MTVSEFVDDCAGYTADPSDRVGYCLERNQRAIWGSIARALEQLPTPALVEWSEDVSKVDPYSEAPFGWLDLNRLQERVAVVSFATAILSLTDGDDYDG